MSRPAVALVTGASGAVGPTLVGQLVEQGQAVRVLVRRMPPSGLFPAPVAMVQGVIEDGQTVQRAVQGAQVVYHLAAKLHVNDPGPEQRAEYERVNVAGTRTLVAAAQAAGVERIVFFSTISVYGASGPGQLLDERSPLRPASWYAETKAQAEQLVLAADGAVVLRVAAVYGPGMKGNYGRMLEALRRRRFVLVGDGQNRRTLVHVADVGAAARLVAQHPGTTGQIYNVTDGRVHTLQTIMEAMATALDQRPLAIHLPVGPVRLASGWLEDGAQRLGKRVPVGRATVDKLTEDVAVSGAKLQDAVGFQPAFDLVAGWRQAVGQVQKTAPK